MKRDDAFSVEIGNGKISHLSSIGDYLFVFSIIEDVQAYIENLFVLYEGIILFCIEKNIKREKIGELYKIFRIPEDKIDIEMPIFYTLEIDANEFFKRIKSIT